MRTAIKKVFVCLMFMTVTHVLVAQEPSEDLSFKWREWSYSYYAGGQEISFEDFMSRLKTGSEVQVPRMFKSGKNLDIVGAVFGGIGASCLGYDLGGRIAGMKRNTTFLVGGGGLMVAGFIMSFIGESKMKKALTLYAKNTVALNIDINTGLGVCLNF